GGYGSGERDAAAERRPVDCAPRPAGAPRVAPVPGPGACRPLVAGFPELLDDALRVPLRPWRIGARSRVVLVERDEQPDELAANGRSAQELRKLGELDQPVRVPRRPVGIVAFDDPVDAVMRLTGLLQERCDVGFELVHS